MLGRATRRVTGGRMGGCSASSHFPGRRPPRNRSFRMRFPARIRSWDPRRSEFGPNHIESTDRTSGARAAGSPRRTRSAPHTWRPAAKVPSYRTALAEWVSHDTSCQVDFAKGLQIAADLWQLWAGRNRVCNQFRPMYDVRSLWRLLTGGNRCSALRRTAQRR